MTRARPLPPDERRAAIIAAARPLLLARGPAFTTREVADAAGVAEGTIFRAFATKDDLLAALIMDVLDPAPAIRRIGDIDATGTLEQLVTEILKALQDRNREAAAYFSAMHAHPGERHHHPDRSPARIQDDIARRAQALHLAIAAALAPHADNLTCTPDEASSLIRALALTASHPHLGDAPVFEPTTLARILTKGLAK